ncbi:DUF6242 domain-containing protein [Bacteroides sp. 224]|uniref:DUF6242 domain-containing protein n=1 Tax=Bacteroides sp. 224 TaxID=2302936 RepID=UPI0013D4A00C|nr:DUF6242 domain-containing protein [Bacteroides sp. 224]NDV66387.1 hypothetical protein [Bacteroides sp. 224]
MKIKLLPAIVSTLFLTLAVTSCLDSNDNIEYSSDDTIKAFSLDTIYGVTYKFTIDQVNGLIYNVDSVPFRADTIINKILIKTLSHSGYVLSGDPDTLFTTTDSLDFSRTMDEPLRISVISQDQNHRKDYKIEVRRHLQEPDELVWRQVSESFSAGKATGEQKSVMLNNQLLTFISNETALRRVNENNSWLWEELNITGLPTEIKLSTITNYNNTLYAVSTDGKVYESDEDGDTWEVSLAISGNVVTLIAAFPNYIAGIVTKDGTPYFAITKVDGNNIPTEWELQKKVPASFPTENLSSTVYKTNTGMYKYMVVGKSANKTFPWFSFDGKNWAESNTASSYYCPAMNQPTIMHYAGQLYIFGEDLSTFYTSLDGLIWKPVTKHVMFPKELKENEDNYSTIIDEDNNLWIFRSSSTGTDEAWRGRVNKLSFKIQ